MAIFDSDLEWVKNAFMVPNFGASRMENRLEGFSAFSTAFQKFTDTSPGGNFAVNPPPQFTPYADPRAKSRYAPSAGMGRKYSEMIDDNSQVIHMSCGVPEFNNLTTFFTTFYDHKASVLSRTGREPGWFYTIGRVVGFVVTLPLQPLMFAGKIYRFLAEINPSKYYYLKPAMPLYWGSVNTIANGIAVNMGLIPRVFADDDLAETDRSTREGENAEAVEPTNSGEIYKDQENFTQNDIDVYHRKLPSVFRSSGGIDVYAVASRAHRLNDQAIKQRQKAAEQAEDSDDLVERLANEAREYVSPSSGNFGDQEQVGYRAYLAAWQAQPEMSGTDDINMASDAQNAEGETGVSQSSITEDAQENRSYFGDIWKFAKAEMADGGRFVSFRVTQTGEMSESITNTVGESGIAQKMNSSSAGAREKRFNFAQGNIGELGGLGTAVGGVMDSINEFASGVASSVGLDGIYAAFGNAYVDIPQEWKDSSVELPKATYSVELRTPYGNKMSRFINLWMPLSMLLAAALPKSVGKAAYDAPFLVELYDKSRCQVRLGMIDSMTITRGVGNLGWTKTQEPLGVNVDFTVVDLSSIMHMPINSSPGIFSQDTAFSDYMAVLGGLSMADQVYVGRKLQLNLTRVATSWSSWTSPARWGQLAAQTIPGQMLGNMMREHTRGGGG